MHTCLNAHAACQNYPYFVGTEQGGGIVYNKLLTKCCHFPEDSSALLLDETQLPAKGFELNF